jgi:Tol biopolymer transport system component
MRRISFFLLVAMVWLSAHAHAASRVDPALHFRTLRTRHFVIYFHQGEDRLASRLAAIAEGVWSQVGSALGVNAPRLTHVILADQSEIANGYATPLPYNTIFVTAAPPPGADALSFTDDWLRLVFTHEFTHIVHLDRSAGWARIVRGMFGRTSLAFPNLWLPTWQIEGLAAWEESALTGEGRLHSGFRTIEVEAAQTGRIEPLDRINGGLTDWPAGSAPYAFGLGFHEYLATHYFPNRFGDLAERTSRSLPFLGSRAFKSVYGKPLGELWSDYRESVSADYPPEDVTRFAEFESLPVRLTHDGFTVLAPRFATPCAGCPPEIFYTVRNPDGFPALKAMRVDGSQQRQVALRYLGSTIGVSKDTIVFDQQQLSRNVGLYSDLYALNRRSGKVRRLTRNQRLQDPDLSPDGQDIICIRQASGQGELLVFHLRDGTIDTVLAALDTEFHTPRWSPDGRSVAVERHRLGVLSELVIVEVATHAVRVVASEEYASIVTPTWTPDGRSIIAAIDREGTFSLNDFDLSNPRSHGRQLTILSSGGLWPDVSPDGTLITFVGYTADGFDVFTLPYSPNPGAYTTGFFPPVSGRVSLPAPNEPPTVATRPYSPLRTLTPTSWFPVVETGDQLRAGAAVNGVDVLGRHAYSVSATWLVQAPADAMTPPQQTPDWDFGYAYDRWQPTFFTSVSSRTSFGAGPADENGHPTPATLRTREFEGGVLFPFRRVRSTRRAFVSLVRTDDRYTLPDGTFTISRTASRIGLAASTARQYGYSISPEDGYTVGGTAEAARRGLGSTADVTTFTVDGRAYLHGLGDHDTVAIRGAAGASTGTPGARRTFLLGGAIPAIDVVDFGREAISLLRGFPPQSFAGTHVALMNADYRFPIARPQRGKGTWPLFVHTIHAAVFADAGEAWTDRFQTNSVKTSVGGELSLNVVAGYSFPFTATIGAAWGHDGADRSNRAAAYLRIGRAF